MLSIFLYLIRILEADEKKNLKTYSILSILTPIVDLFSISMLLPILNQAVTEAEISKELILFTFGMNICILFKGGFELYKSRILNRLINAGAQKLSVKLYELLMKEDLQKHNDRGAMQSLTMIRGDSASCMGLLVSGIDIVSAGLTITGFLGVLIAVTGWIGLLSGCAFFFCLASVYLFYKKNMNLYGEQKRKYEIRLNGQITITYGMFKVLKLDDCWKKALKRYENYSRKFARTQEEYSFKNTVVSIFLNNVIQAAFFLLLLLTMVLEIKITSVLAEIVVFITLLVRMLPIGNSIVKGLHSMEFGRDAYESLRSGMAEYENIKKEEENRIKLREKKVTFHKGLQVRNLTFAYRDNENIFTDASVDIPVGKSIAVIGPSGSGKSTFLDLLLGLLSPQQGHIYYDDYDIVEGTDKEGKCNGNLGNIVSYIPQTIYLNGETVRNNVAFFSEDIDDAKVREALAAAQVLEDVEKLPEGIYSLIGEHGASISGGQRQRVALARALYRDFELLVMDEATAALDMDTEQAVMDSIRQVKHNKTILLVTHHINLANACDLIYKIENQKMVRIK